MATDARRRSDDHLPVAHDHPRDRIERDGLRQARTQRIQPAGPGGKRAVSRFTQTERFLRFLPFSELGVRPHTKGLGFRARALRRFVQPRTIQRLRRVTARGEQELALVPFDRPGVLDAQRHGSNRSACGDERDHDITLTP